MREFSADAEYVVRAMFEDMDSDADESEDIKDVYDTEPSTEWEQIDGDANPWIYGGTWLNPADAAIIHFDGIEHDEETDQEEIPIPATMLAKLPPEDEDWTMNRERDSIIGNYRYARAAFLEARKERTFYRLDVPLGSLPYEFRKYEKQCPEGLGIEDDEWQQLSLVHKFIELCRYFGWEEHSNTFTMNHIEAQQVLGSNNI